MWVRKPCRAVFNCAGVEVECEPHPYSNHTGRCVCLCPAHDVQLDMAVRRTTRRDEWNLTSTESPLVSNVDRSSSCSTRLVYRPSEWEGWWTQHVPYMLGSDHTWQCGCAALRESSELLRRWQHAVHQRELTAGPNANCSAAATTLNPIFSYHSVVRTCDGQEEELLRVPIEPLVGFLRHPSFMHRFCSIDTNTFTNLARIDTQLLPLRLCERDTLRLRPAPRSLLFDVGAGLWNQGPGGGSLRWLVTAYEANGIQFDRILAWEATNHTGAEMFRRMPLKVMDTISYYNVPVDDAAPTAPHNPLRALRYIARAEDFVVLKLDMDPRSDIEESLIAQLIADEGLSSLVDELYYEHHVFLSPMIQKGWGDALLRAGSTQTLATSYNIFSKLRELGIRAHSWV